MDMPIDDRSQAAQLPKRDRCALRARAALVVLVAIGTLPATVSASDDDDDDSTNDDKASAKATPPAPAPVPIENLTAAPVIPPPRRVAAKGFFAEGGLGAVAFLPNTSRSAAIGPALSLRLGIDLWSWLSVGMFLSASTHEATVPPPPTGEWFQLYRGGADGRLSFLLERLAFFAEGGAGIAMVSSNVLEKPMILDPGEAFSIAFHAGAGVEYQWENRHYAVGIGVDGFLVPQFASPSGTMKAIDSRLYLRYTYGG